MCAVSLVASARPLAIELPKIGLPKLSLPKLSLPKLPELDLPNFGKKKGPAAPKAAPRAPPVGDVKVRPAAGVVPTGSSEDAPTLAELTGRTAQRTIGTGAGFKRFPERRMPGANMDGWKKIAKDMAPKI